MQKSVNCEKYAVVRSARIQVHRYGWGGKPSLKEEKQEARRKFRRRWKKMVHFLFKKPDADAHIDQRPIYTCLQRD